MKRKSPKFERKKELALKALLLEKTIQDAARVVGVSEVTLWRWLKEPAFSEEYRELKREAVGQAITRLQQISSQAVEVLREIMVNNETPASVRVNSAKAIIEMAVKAVEIENIVNRIDELEKALIPEVN